MQTHDGNSSITSISTWVFRSVKKLNPVYMQSLFEKIVNSKRYKDGLKVPIIRNSLTFGDKSLRVIGPHIWNMLPSELKKETSYGKFNPKTGGGGGGQLDPPMVFKKCIF